MNRRAASRQWRQPGPGAPAADVSAPHMSVGLGFASSLRPRRMCPACVAAAGVDGRQRLRGQAGALGQKPPSFLLWSGADLHNCDAQMTLFQPGETVSGARVTLCVTPRGAHSLTW